MNKENVRVFLKWFYDQIRNEPPSSRWLKRQIVNEKCKELDVPLSYLETNYLVAATKEAVYLIEIRGDKIKTFVLRWNIVAPRRETYLTPKDVRASVARTNKVPGMIRLVKKIGHESWIAECENRPFVDPARGMHWEEARNSMNAT